MLKHDLLKQLDKVVSEYNTYFHRLSKKDEVDPPELPKYDATTLGEAIAAEFAVENGGIIDGDRYNAIMRPAKIGQALIKTNNTAQTFAIGAIRGGYGLEL